MNWVPMYIPPRVPALISGLFVFTFLSHSLFAVRGYETFDLPAGKVQTIPPQELNFKKENLRIKAGKARIQTRSYNAQEYVFAKEAYVSRRRDDAIKLIRQRLELGTKKNRDNQLLRLGQLQTEKYMELNFYENELHNQALDKFEKEQAAGKAKKKKVPKPSNTRSRRYLKLALKAFETLEKEYPRFYKMDELVFFIGFVHMEIGNKKKGVRYLTRVTRDFKKSRKYEEALLYLGDHYFYQQKFKTAYKNFKILASRRNSSIYHYALYKKAWCELNLGRASVGLKNMKSLIALLKESEEKAKFNLKEQAQRDIVVFFVELGIVDNALEYFTELEGSKKAFEKLKMMAAAWLSKAQDKPAIKAYELLIREYNDSPEVLRLKLALFEARSRLGRQTKAVKTLVGAIQKHHPESDWADDSKKSAPKVTKNSIEELKKTSLKAASFYHHTAQKTKNKSYYGHAEKIYAAMIKYFPKIKERRKFVFLQGEILFAQKKYLLASEKYMKLAKSKPKDKLAQQAAYNALLALDALTYKSKKIKRYSVDEQKSLKVKKQEIPEQDRKFIEVANFYFTEYPKAPKKVEVLFRIGRIYYQYQHFDKSQKYFNKIATEYPKHKSAATAANIVLDIYNIRKDYAGLNKASLRFASIKGLGNRAFRNEMKSIQSQIAFKKIEKLEKEKKWEEAGDAYLNYYRTKSKDELAQKALYNAVISFEKTKNAAKTNEASKLFVAKFPKHALTKRLNLKIAKAAEEDYRFEQAQVAYLKFYKKYPKDPQARSALYNAAIFAEILEQNSNALNLYDKYLRTSRVSSAQKRSIWLSQASLYKKRRYFSKVEKIYEDLLRTVPSQKEKFALLAELADMQHKNKRITKRNQTLKRISRAYGSGKKASIVGTALPYVAWHRYLQIEPERKKYERAKLRLPPQRLVANIKTKQSLLSKLEPKYDKIVNLGDPKWGVASLYQKANAYQQFIDSYRSMKVPSSYKGKQKEELLKEIKVLDAQIIAPLEKKAGELFQACIDKAAEFFVVGEFVEKCHAKRATAIAHWKPEGLLPKPSYWTTRWIDKEIAN